MRLISPKGKAIVATFDTLEAKAWINNSDIHKDAEGGYAFDYAGESEVIWDSQEVVRKLGQRVFLDEDGELWLERELKVVREEEEPVLTPSEAQRFLNAMCGKLATAYPEAGLSFGYIGNLWTDGRPNPDERAWSFFTKLDNPTLKRWPYGGVSTSELGELYYKADVEFPAWLHNACGRDPEKFEYTHGI